MSLADELRGLFLFTLLWVLLHILRQGSAAADWLVLPTTLRQAGILLALSFFFAADSWFIFPIHLILGFVMLHFWLLPHEHAGELRASTDVWINKQTYIREIIGLNRVQRASQSLLKTMRDKLGKGEVEYEEYKSKLGQLEGATAEQQRKLLVNGFSAQRFLLAFGPTDSAWQNGLLGARYGFLFSLPWTYLYLRELLAAPASGYYFVQNLLWSIPLVLLKWPLYGFFFGYFYPHLRGRNGVEKGLCFFLTLTIPSLIITVLQSPLESASVHAFIFWALQVFVHSMLLGLVVGDLETLRRAGYGWGELIEAHPYPLAGLSAWASTILIAAGTAMTTLLVSDVTGLVSEALQYVGLLPDIPLPGPPPKPPR